MLGNFIPSHDSQIGRRYYADIVRGWIQNRCIGWGFLALLLNLSSGLGFRGRRWCYLLRKRLGMMSDANPLA